MTTKRDRSYHDLSAEEKVRYDGLRKRARETGWPQSKVIDDEADAMLGLRVVDTRTPGAWKPGAGVNRSEVDHQARNAGTSRDFGHQ